MTDSSTPKNNTLITENWGLISFSEAWEKQERIFKKKVSGKLSARRAGKPSAQPNHLFFCEHPHVYTLGKSGTSDHLLIDESERREKNIEFFKINRGGDITYHGFGQMVAYPILDLANFFEDLHLYLRKIEDAVIFTLAEYGLRGDRFPGYTGVWLDPENPEKARKICAVGVRSSQWITMHGLALNVNTDLSYFDHIVPCGIKDKDVASLDRELGREIPLTEVQQVFDRKFREVFGING